MAGRPRKFNEEEIIQKATEVFWAKGYEATSSEDLLKAMGIGKGSFYLLFKGGKEELFIRTMEQRSEFGFKKISKRLTEASDKREVIKELFHERLNGTDNSKNYGCYMGNTIVEMSNLNPQLKDLAAKHLFKFESLFFSVVKESIEAEKLKTDKSPQYIAKYLINSWNGMNITKRMGNDKEMLIDIIDQQLKIID